MQHVCDSGDRLRPPVVSSEVGRHHLDQSRVQPLPGNGFGEFPGSGSATHGGAHRVSPAEQLTDDVAADIAGGTGYQHQGLVTHPR